MDDSYFEKIPLWDRDSPKFDIFADDINGRIPVTRLERWQRVGWGEERTPTKPMGNVPY
ncbi:MAG: hypothetical protein L3J59_09505 [Methylococcaceae bacterium]|nr:hypothetical protein [Methylococcaceae bacterium]